MNLRFPPFVLDSETRQLLRDGREVRLSPKAFDLLVMLAERRPRVVTKSELHAAIWPDTFVVEANLNVLIGEVRQALSDTPREARFIRTVHKVGYAFCAEADEAGSPAASRPDTGAARSWLAWNDQTFVLSAGENIIGRDPACHVWVDASGVSRRHARVQIENTGAWVEDLGSTNGTLLRNRQLDGRLVPGHAASIVAQAFGSRDAKKRSRRGKNSSRRSMYAT